MIQTNVSTEPALDMTPRTTPPSWVEAHEIVQEFPLEPDFIDSLASTDSQHSDTTTIEYAKALSQYARQYCEKREANGSIKQIQIDQIKLLANAPYYLHNQKDISFYENERAVRRLSDDEWQRYQDFKPYMIWYNQLLADYAYTNPLTKLSDLDTALVQEALPYFPGESEAVQRNLKQAVRGARTEAVSRELLDRTPVNYSPGTIDDDLRGGDLIVTYKDHRVKVDIKSSISDIAAVRGGYDAIDTQHLHYAILKARSDGNDKAKYVVVLFPGFTDSDMGDFLSLQLPEQNIQEHADSLTKQLRLAFRELQI